MWKEEGGGVRGGDRQDTKGREFVFVFVGPPGGDCWIVEVNESDWLVGVFLLVLRFAHSQGFTSLLFHQVWLYHSAA